MPVYASQQLEETRSIVKEWVATEKAISKETIAWKDKEAHLNDLIKLTKIEIKQLEKEIAVVETFTSTADKRRENLLLREKEMKGNSKEIRLFLSGMERKLQLLKPQLPKPLQEELTPFYQQLSLDSQKTSLGIAKRMQTVVGILSAIQKFDKTVTVAEEIKTLSDGSRGAIKTLYLGLAVAYYLSANDAGYGYPSKKGWVWESLPKKQNAIEDAIAIAENTSQKIGFIPLPIKVKNQSFNDEE